MAERVVCRGQQFRVTAPRIPRIVQCLLELLLVVQPRFGRVGGFCDDLMQAVQPLRRELFLSRTRHREQRPEQHSET